MLYVNVDSCLNVWLLPKQQEECLNCPTSPISLSSQAKNAADRAKLKAGTEVTIADTKIVLSEEIANEATIVSDIFNLNEMDALDLILIGWLIQNFIVFVLGISI